MSSGAAAAIRSGSWVGSAPTQTSGAGDSGGPINIVSWALEYVEPLCTWYDNLVGSPSGIEQTANSWEQLERTLNDLSDDAQRLHNQLEPYEGRTIRVLQLRYKDLQPVAQDAADYCGAAAAGIRLAGSISQSVRSFIRVCLDQIELHIRTVFGFSLNPFDKIDQLNQLVDAAGAMTRDIRDFITSMFDAFERLIGFIAKLGPLIDNAERGLSEIVAKMLPLVGQRYLGIPGLIGGAILNDALIGIGDVEQYDIDELRRQHAAATGEEKERLQKKIDAWEDAHKVKSLNSFSDIVGVNGTTDALGSNQSTAIDVKLVRAADGTEHWVVSLPSTQDWFDMFGSGAMNDGRTNLSLMLNNDGITTQYERAVMRAMQEAGMSPGDPVVFTGFSQGGIMAANLASDPKLPYNTIGVVTNGSPIDTFKIPQHIPVVSFQHATDPVPMADLNIDGDVPSNVRRVVLENPSSNPFAFDRLHNNSEYVTSMKDSRMSNLDHEYAWMGGDVIDHQIFNTTQR